MIKKTKYRILLLVLLSFAVSLPSFAQQSGRKLNNRDNKPYDARLIRLAELLGAIHYLRELCGANEGQVWRKQMADLVEAESTTPLRRVKLVTSFNKGYRGYRRTYRNCTKSAKLAVDRSIKEGAEISATIVSINK